MKSRFMFLVQRRGGGTLLNRLLAQISDEEERAANTEFARVVPLPTAEYCLFHSLYTSVPEMINRGIPGIPRLQAFSTYAEADGYDPNLPLYTQCLPSWATNNLEEWLPSHEWEVFTLVRDGRNHVTSLAKGEYRLREMENGITDEKEPFEFLEDMKEFEKQCYIWKLKNRLYLDSAQDHDHFHLIRFEDLVADPYGFLAELLIKCELIPELDDVVSVHHNVTSVWRKSESHYHPPEIQNNRHLCWQEAHYEMCYRIMSPELKDLGYTGRGIDSP